MKKIALAFAALLLSASASFAQEEDLTLEDIIDSPGLNYQHFGIRVSYELSAPGDITYPGSALKSSIFGNSSGFSIEGIYNIPVWKNLYIQPGVGIYYNTYSIDKRVLDYDYEVNSASARQWGFRIPLHIGYNYDFIPDLRIAVFTGPELNVSFRGRSHYGIGKYDVSGPLFGEDGYLNRTDVKWRFGVGATIASTYYVAVSGAVGMCDMARDYKTADGKIRQNMHSNLFDITLGYNF